MSSVNLDRLIANAKAKAPVLSVRNLKTLAANATPEGAAWSCSLYVDGKRAATVGYDGWGGPYRYHWLDRAVGERVEAWVQTLPPDDSEYGPLPADLDTIVARLADDYEAKLWLRRQCRDKALYRLPGDATDQWRTVALGNMTFPVVKNLLITDRFPEVYPDVDVSQIVWANEEVA
jgi:hypothetical protein